MKEFAAVAIVALFVAFAGTSVYGQESLATFSDACESVADTCGDVAGAYLELCESIGLEG